MNQYRIRSAISGDEAGIAHVHVQSWRETYSGLVVEKYIQDLDEEAKRKSWGKRLLNLMNGHTIYVAVAPNERIVGFVTGGPAREQYSDYPGELYAIYILKAHHRKGVGRLLVKRLFNDLLGSKIFAAYVCVIQGNQARYFYEKMGARIWKESTFKLGDEIVKEDILVWDDLNTLI